MRPPLELHEFRTATAEPVERGRELGRAHAARIRRTWTEYAEYFAAKGLDGPAVTGFAEGVLGELAGWSPRLRSELAGIAEGAGLPETAIAALNARTELIARSAANGASECSTAVWLPPRGAARTVQTWDWLEGLSGAGLLAELPGPDGRVVRLFTEFGILGKIGVSSAGLGVHFNILNHRADGGDPGVPVHLVARRILDEASSVEEAVGIAASARVSASSVVTVVHGADEGSAAACIEISPAGIAALPAGPGDVLVHANTFVDPLLAACDDTPDWSSSRRRHAFLERRAQAALVAAEPAARAAALAVEPGTSEPSVICMVPDSAAAPDMRWQTKLTVSLDLTGAALDYAVGAPTGAPEAWRRFG